MKNVKNYKIKYSNFYYKSNGKYISDENYYSDNVNENNLSYIDSIELTKENIDNLNEIEKTNYDETNTKEILQCYLDEFNVDDIDYKVEIIKDYVDEFIELDDVIQIIVENENFYMNDYGYNKVFGNKILS